MGMSSGGNKGGVQSEINVTPLIDVLLVLLIIFLVVMPVMMKMETIQVPRKLDTDEMPDPNASMLTVKVLGPLGQQMVFVDNDKETPINESDLLTMLRPKLEAIGARGGGEKVVFVDFEDAIPWGTVINTMDSIRSLASDVENHDEIKVALKVKEDKTAPQ
jgi:biopolymer transport protein TolR